MSRLFDASLGKNSLFFPRAAAVVARVDRMPEVEPPPGSAPGGEARAAKVAREKPPLSAVTAALRARLGIASDAVNLPSTGKKFFDLLVLKLPGAVAKKGGKGTLLLRSVVSQEQSVYQTLLDRAEAYEAANPGTGGAGGAGEGGNA